ncbi:hypothetical protein AWC38_SpisGene6668 [Stylophora pistillata]|uniref:Uncharacterized protein n=1 Tax=Stylophora pistillata TaxID=50429 RepID=A0A2B4SJK9_STYPI|nr:hypothetical protein AWC38_SpisGene6668 [Stylophora pistillata]
MEVYKVVVLILVIFFYCENGRETGFNNVVGRIQDGGLPSTKGAAAWRQKRSPGDEPSCYTGRFVSIRLPSNKEVTVPICMKITSSTTACISSMANNNNQRKCVPSHMIKVEGVALNTACSCAP